MYERDLYRDDVITMANSIELRLPFLDKELVRFALKIPAKYKIEGETTKLILRNIALESGIPPLFALRKKVAAQYGSRMNHAIGTLAKRERLSKSQYLRQFYPSHNLKLGVLFSSGKDSISAAYIMKKQNYELACLITMKSKNPHSYMFQTAGTELVELQAEAMGLPLIVQETEGEKEKELEDLELAMKRAKEQYKIDGIVSGALFSTYQRDRIERICDTLGLKIFSPLWHKPQEQHMREVIDNGFDVVLSAVAADGLDTSWLGRTLTEDDVRTLKELAEKVPFNQAGEGGEFESMVLDCPLFRKKIVITEADVIEENQYTAHLLVRKAVLVEK
jgi:asparagine synthase (glutamine-hydrolysing)